MYSINEYVIINDKIDKNLCNKIINLEVETWQETTTGSGWELGRIDIPEPITDEERFTGKKLNIGKDKNIRLNDIRWTSDQLLYDAVWPHMEKANELSGWKYDIRAAEAMQIARYKKGEFYYFHKDGRGDNLSAYDQPDNEWKHGRVRKLSMSVLLNEDFEGGEFQFATYNKEECEIVTPKDFNKTGSIIIFPSDAEHRIAPITNGIRYSLVVWFVGPPFK